MADKYNGVINVYKEPGFTSHDVVAKLRGITHQKKIGHTGTLDPDAEGVLCICFGAATHVCDMLTDRSKEYEAVMLLGVKTDTQDTSGIVISEAEVKVSDKQIRECVSGFVGDIMQIPPMYSALKVGGKKLYELAREGKEIERKPRQITISNIEIISIDLPRVTMRVSCSKGTYIRTLCNDIGESLGCGAAMEHLIRTRVGEFEIEKSLRLDEINEYQKKDRLSDILISPFNIFDDLPCLIPNEIGTKRAQNGNVLRINEVSLKNHNMKDSNGNNHNMIDSTIDGLHNEDQVRVVSDEGFFYGVYEYRQEERLFHPVKMFLC